MTAPLVFDDLTYIPIAEAAVGSHFSTEYLARLARTGRLRGRIVAHMWFIEMHSLQQFIGSRDRRKSSRRLSVYHKAAASQAAIASN
jgi:hypothetical protein